MKKIILLSTITSVALFATNGDLMMGHGAKATAMGGVGIAISHGAESAYANPAMLKDVKGREFDLAVTMFMPDVQFASDAESDAGGTATAVPAYQTSDADQSFLPELSYVQRNNEHIVWGIALGGTAGMGVDQVGKPSGAYNMKTELQVAKLGVPVAYTNGDFTIGVEPVLQYSTLEMNYQTQQGASKNPKSSSTGFGVNVGIAYDLGGLTLGALYQSKIEASYDDNIKSAMRDFGVTTVTSGDSLDQPTEMGVGAAYTMGSSTLAVDLKKVEWSKAKGYREFGWEDQNIIAVGYQYQALSWAFRAGYNHGKSPIQELNGAPAADGSTYPNAAINFFNLSGFPAMVEEHFTVGGDYMVTDNLGLTLALVYSPEATESFDTTAMSAGSAFNGARGQGASLADAGAAAQAASTGSTANVKHSQKAVTVGMTYNF